MRDPDHQRYAIQDAVDFSERHGAEVIQVVQHVDQADKARKKVKMDAKQATTAAQKAEEK